MTRALCAFLLCAAFACADQAQVLVPPPPPPPPSPASAAPAENQTAMPPSSGPYAITGVVLSATTGAPLDRAGVTLSTPGARSAQLAATVSGEAGGFRFDGLAAGKYVLQASRRGYIAAAYQQHEGGFSTAIVTGANLQSTGLRLQLNPDSSIGGVVTDDFGDPVAGAMIRLFRQQIVSGDTLVRPAAVQTTDGTGAYEFPRLRPGIYFLCVSATPWYAFHPQPRRDSSGNPLPDIPQHAALDVAYPTTFYANATDSTSATPIALNPGDRQEINVALHAVPAVHLQVTLPAGDGLNGRAIRVPQFEQDIFGTDQFLRSDFVVLSEANGQMTAEVNGLSPGHYVVRQAGPGAETNRRASLDLTGDQSVDIQSLGAGGADLSGKLVMADGAALPDNTTLSLQASGSTALQNRTPVSADGMFDLPSVPPGTWDVRVSAPGAALSVLQMAASGAEVHGSHIVIGGNSVLLAATLAEGSVTLTGFARSGGKGQGGVMVLLVPRDPGSSTELYRRDQSDSDGSFTFNRVVPGDYIAVAIADGWNLDWARREAIAPYLARGLALHIAAQQSSTELPAPLEVQPR